MYLGIEKIKILYNRKSKHGLIHQYERIRSYIIFRCDSCSQQFTRLKGNIDPKRLSNNYFHCCSNCDSKKFAQKKGAERRMIWKLPASSLNDISKL